MWGHPDQEEGPRAFAEKREPQWQPLGTTETGTVTDVGDRHRGHRLHRAARGSGAGVQPLVRARPHVRRDHRRPGRVLGRALGRDPRVQGGAARRARRGSATPRAARSSRRCGCSTDASPSGTRGSARQMERLRAERRSDVRGPRPPAHRGVPLRRAKRAPTTASSAATALDHPFAGVVAIAVPAGGAAATCGRASWAPSCRPSRCSRRERVDPGRRPSRRRTSSCSASRPVIRSTRGMRGVAPVLASLPARRLREPVRPYDPRHRRLRRTS